MKSRLFPITAKMKREILEAFEGRCIYCRLPIGGVILRNNKPVLLVAHVDHFVPYAYCNNTKFENCVLSCNVCNQIKSSKIYASIEIAREKIMIQRKKKGYSP